MNKFKKITLGLLGAALLATGLYSCSNDNETTDVQQIEKDAQARGVSKDTFLKNYYQGKVYNLGRNVGFSNIEGGFKLSEVLLDDVNQVGYLIEDINTNKLLYFADKNLNSDELNFENLITGEKDKLTKISTDSVFNASRKFDFIYVVNLIKEDNNQSLGWIKRFNIDRIWKNREKDCGSAYRVGDEESPLLGKCVQDCTFTNYRFFIESSQTLLPGVPTGNDDC